ncbi:MAG: helix-turn-helix domain-containing protein [Desulfobacterales bacterium]|nr:helix-turn-helix domain-containing protein [Desulfobacterales bacterium]
MRKRHPNHRLVKIHRSYTVEEIANLFGIHKNTVRRWVKTGLATSDDKRPMLILGHELAAFLQARRVKNKQPCRPGEIYCVRCRAPKFPAGDMAEYSPITEKFGNLIAICPDCNSIMNRRVSLAKIWQVRGKMDITFPQAIQHIVSSPRQDVQDLQSTIGQVGAQAKENRGIQEKKQLSEAAYKLYQSNNFTPEGLQQFAQANGYDNNVMMKLVPLIREFKTWKDKGALDKLDATQKARTFESDQALNALRMENAKLQQETVKLNQIAAEREAKGILTKAEQAKIDRDIAEHKKKIAYYDSLIAKSQNGGTANTPTAAEKKLTETNARKDLEAKLTAAGFPLDEFGTTIIPSDKDGVIDPKFKAILNSSGFNIYPSDAQKTESNLFFKDKWGRGYTIGSYKGQDAQPADSAAANEAATKTDPALILDKNQLDSLTVTPEQTQTPAKTGALSNLKTEPTVETQQQDAAVKAKDMTGKRINPETRKPYSYEENLEYVMQEMGIWDKVAAARERLKARQKSGMDRVKARAMTEKEFGVKL